MMMRSHHSDGATSGGPHLTLLRVSLLSLPLVRMAAVLCLAVGAVTFVLSVNSDVILPAAPAMAAPAMAAPATASKISRFDFTQTHLRASAPFAAVTTLLSPSELEMVRSSSFPGASSERRRVDLLSKNTSSSNRPSPDPRISVTSSPMRGGIGNTKRGYVLGYSIWEQQSNGLKNLFELKCWANSVNVSLVKPYTVNSFFLTPLQRSIRRKLLPLDMYFNFSKHGGDEGSYPEGNIFVDWQEFVSTASRNVVVVDFVYKGKKKFHKERSCVQGDKYLPYYRSEESFSVGIFENGFTVVRNVCLNFYNYKDFTESQFYREVYGEYSPDAVTVIMLSWRGIRNTNIPGRRVAVNMHSSCKDYNIANGMFDAKPSDVVTSDAEKYIKTHYGNNSFISVMLRTEKVLVNAGLEAVVSSLENTVEVWKNVTAEYRLNYTFLAADCGPETGTKRFVEGGKKARDRKITFMITELGDAVTKRFFGGGASLSSWEQSFGSLSSSDRGYIALVQQAIAVRSTCIIFSGGGVFQKRTEALYKRSHSDERQWCVYRIE